MSEVRRFELEIPDQFKPFVFLQPIETIEQEVDLEHGPTMVSYRLFSDNTETADYSLPGTVSEEQVDSVTRLEYVRLPNGLVQFHDGYTKLSFDERFIEQEQPDGSSILVFDTTCWLGSNPELS